jgi:hypothetical protein
MLKAAAIDTLAQSIAKMPLSSQALAETFVTASSLIQLLPVQTRDVRQGISGGGRTPTAQEWVPILLCLCLILGVTVAMISNHPSTATAIAQTADIQSSPDQTVAAKPLVMPTVAPGH